MAQKKKASRKSVVMHDSYQQVEKRQLARMMKADPAAAPILLGVRVPPFLKQLVKMHAARHNLTMAAVVEEALIRHIRGEIMTRPILKEIEKKLAVSKITDRKK